MNIRLHLLVVLSCVFAAPVFAGAWDLGRAFTPFAHKTGRAEPLDFRYLDLKLPFDVPN